MQNKVFFMVGEGTLDIDDDKMIVVDVNTVYGSGIAIKGTPAVDALTTAMAEVKRNVSAFADGIAGALYAKLRSLSDRCVVCLWADIGRVKEVSTPNGGKRTRVVLRPVGDSEGFGAVFVDFTRKEFADGTVICQKMLDSLAGSIASDSEAELQTVFTAAMDACNARLKQLATTIFSSPSTGFCKCQGSRASDVGGPPETKTACSDKPAACKCSTKPGHFDAKPPKRPSRAKKAVR